MGLFGKQVMKELFGGTLIWASSSSKPCGVTLAMLHCCYPG